VTAPALGRWRLWLGALVLAAQAAAIVHARFVESRYFCWAPNRSIQHVKDVVAAYERTRGDGGARVALRYRTNGGPPRLWRWPEDRP
jgi:hypothetical protein